jgi:predicted transport protein
MLLHKLITTLLSYDNLINNKLLFHDHKNISNWGKSDVNVIIGHNTCHYLISRLP